MKIQVLSDQSLQDLHSLIREALCADDAAPKNERPYGVREFPDWKKQADAFEAELAKRGIAFAKIDWAN